MNLVISWSFQHDQWQFNSNFLHWFSTWRQLSVNQMQVSKPWRVLMALCQRRPNWMSRAAIHLPVLALCIVRVGGYSIVMIWAILPPNIFSPIKLRNHKNSSTEVIFFGLSIAPSRHPFRNENTSRRIIWNSISPFIHEIPFFCDKRNGVPCMEMG